MKTKTAGSMMLVVGSAMGVVLVACCCGASMDFRKADKAASEGRYDEAIVIYEQILAENPDNENGTRASKGIEDTLLVQADHLFAEGEYAEAGRVYRHMTERFRGSGSRKDEVEAGDSLFQAQIFAIHVDNGPSDAAFDEVYAVWSEEEGAFKAAVAEWLCDNRADFPAYTTCRDVDPDVADMTIDVVRDRVTNTEEACSRLQRLSGVCGGDFATEITDMTGEAGGLAKLRTAAAEREVAFKKDTERALAEGRASMLGDARMCEEKKRDTIAVIMRAYRFVDRSVVESQWAVTPPGADGGIGHFKSIMVMGLDNTERKMKSPLYSDRCNTAIEAGYRKLREGCLDRGAPVDLEWIDDVGKAECP